jgi:UDP-glucose 4-epimerase
VTVFSRSFCALARTLGASTEQITLIRGEIAQRDDRTRNDLSALIGASEIVFYFAGTSTVPRAADDPAASITDYVAPFVATLEQMRATSTRTIVVASSGGSVYGRTHVLPTPEDHPLSPISIHGHNAVTIERYAGFYAEHHGYLPVILRFGNPYGPTQVSRSGQGVVAAWSEALALGRRMSIIGDGSTRRDFVFIDDAAAAVAAAAFGPPGPVTYNVGSGESHSLEQVRRVVELAAGRTGEVHRLPGRPADVPITELDCTRLRTTTGWEPRTTLRDGIARTWEWALDRAHAGAAAPIR